MTVALVSNSLAQPGGCAYHSPPSDEGGTGMKARAALASLICLVLVAAVGPAAQGIAGRGELLRAPSRGPSPSLP
jgi:hypothetical protein